MENFTPFSAIAGGALIGSGALILLLATGRIAGISGIASSALFQHDGRSWRLAFVAGLLVAPLVLLLAGGDIPFNPPIMDWTVLLAGLLVGLGTRWGNGCTSGHGICGVSRLSVRSLTATAIFMLAAMLTATLLS